MNKALTTKSPDNALPQPISPRRLQVKDCSQRRGLMHLRVHGKGGKIRFLPVHPRALMRIQDCLEVAGHGAAPEAPLFQLVKNNRSGTLAKHLEPCSVHRNIVVKLVTPRACQSPGTCTRCRY